MIIRPSQSRGTPSSGNGSENRWLGQKLAAFDASLGNKCPRPAMPRSFSHRSIAARERNHQSRSIGAALPQPPIVSEKLCRAHRRAFRGPVYNLR